MQLRWISATGVAEHPVDAAAELLTRPDGLVWLDVPSWDEAAERLLRDVFGVPSAGDQRLRAAQPGAEGARVSRSRVPGAALTPRRRRRSRPLHRAGPVHRRPVPGDRARPAERRGRPGRREARGRRAGQRLESGKLRPRQAYELSYALASAVAKRLREFTARLTADMWDLEYRFQAVVKEGPSGHLRDPEQFLDELFGARHGFMVARTQAAMSREVFARMHKIKAFGPGRGQKRIDDAVDQFDHLRAMADGEKENLQGTIEFYQARTNTKVTIAAERLAVIAAITLPVTAVSSILGMNVIVNDTTQPADSRSR